MLSRCRAQSHPSKDSPAAAGIVSGEIDDLVCAAPLTSGRGRVVTDVALQLDAAVAAAQVVDPGGRGTGITARGSLDQILPTYDPFLESGRSGWDPRPDRGSAFA